MSTKKSKELKTLTERVKLKHDLIAEIRNILEGDSKSEETITRNYNSAVAQMQRMQERMDWLNSVKERGPEIIEDLLDQLIPLEETLAENEKVGHKGMTRKTLKKTMSKREKLLAQLAELEQSG